MPIRALFVGGTIDNSELDLDGHEPPVHYPPRTGNGIARYRLHALGVNGGDITATSSARGEMNSSLDEWITP